MAGSATITGTQNYIMGIGHPKTEATTEAPPAVFSTDPLTGEVEFQGPVDTYGAIDSNGVADPLTNPTAVVGAAGALTGAYYYAFTYVTPMGETGPTTGTATVVNPSSQRIEVSGITVCPDSRCTARKLYRTPAVTGTVDPKDYKLVATIADNTTTTYSDNTADGSLGADMVWISQTQGELKLNGSKVANFSGQSTGLGVGALATYKGYASVAVGYNALNVVTSGKRNTAVGVYALAANTTGYENTAMGTHAGNGNTVGVRNTLLGYQAGGITSSTLDFNTAVGHSALLGSGAAKGSGNTAIGYRALADINTADYCIALGFGAGKYANASRMVFIDGADRGNITNCQNIGLIYGKHESTAIAQVLHLNAPTRIGPPSVTVATLPAAAAGYAGFRAFVTDANATTFASIVAGGGANGVPVYCDGANWRIG